ncbi:MAG: MBL fold metallo-hydrolase [Bacteroidales bacterium]
MWLKIIPFGTLVVDVASMFNGLSHGRVASYYAPDERNEIRIALNALLVVAGDRVVLIDPGCADFLPARIRDEYRLHLPVPLNRILDGSGYSDNEVTDVVFTHLHFDHGSGAFRRVRGGLEKRFPKARYHVSRAHYEYALDPDPAEADSMFARFLKHAEPLHWLEDWKEPWMEFRYAQGHTRHMAVPVIHTPGSDTWFLTDLMPMAPFLERDVNSGYDLDPDLARREKVRFLDECSRAAELILFHEPEEAKVFYPCL